MDRYTVYASKLKGMGHPVRLRILEMLRRGEICVCHIERALAMRQAYVSQQLRVLRDAGLVDARKDGLQVYYRLADDDAAALLNLIYGPPDAGTLETLEDCRCPACSNVLVPSMDTSGE